MKNRDKTIKADFLWNKISTWVPVPCGSWLLTAGQGTWQGAGKVLVRLRVVQQAAPTSPAS